MAIQVRVLGHPRDLHLMGAGSGAFFHPRVEPEPDLRRIGFGCGFYFSPVGSLNTRKQPIKCSFSPIHHESSLDIFKSPLHLPTLNPIPSRPQTRPSRHIRSRARAALLPNPSGTRFAAGGGSALTSGSRHGSRRCCASGPDRRGTADGGELRRGSEGGPLGNRGGRRTLLLSYIQRPARSWHGGGTEARPHRGGSVPVRHRGIVTRPYPDLVAMWPYPVLLPPTLTGQTLRQQGNLLLLLSYTWNPSYQSM
jgi:hypothetical protein